MKPRQPRIAWTVALVLIASTRSRAYEPINVGFLWHMHQPIYYPYESVTATDANGRFPFSVVDVHNQRFGPYTTWPRDAIQAGLGQAHLGAQVSFSGSLIENLNALESAGVNGGMWSNWRSGYNQGRTYATSLGNRRLDLVGFGYHHPLMALLDEEDMRMQIKLHKHVYAQTWSGSPAYSHGIFPPETAFSWRMIPALVAEGLQWVLVDNIHFDRACQGYPYTPASNLIPPNPSDVINPNPGNWVQLQNLWAPSRVSAPFGYQPHRVQYVDPDTGVVTTMIAVPAARYEGNEDGRGGYGAFLYDGVMDGYIQFNTDAAHPMFVVLHHDGDNYGGGSEAYYHSNFQNMVNWVASDPDYDVTTVDDYLARFPVAAGDVIHIEDGAWSGADNGDPEFKKWLADPDGAGWSPDRNSWAVLTAAKNRVFTADAISPAVSMQNVLVGAGSSTERAWHYLLCSEASDYWYWDGQQVWDNNVTRGCNQAVAYADQVITGGAEFTPPTVFAPQREPYNPGGYEWGSTPMPSDFEVWTYIYDVSGLASVTLRWRVDADGVNPIASTQNETYAGGPDVGAWNGIAMTAAADPPAPGGILNPTYRAARYRAMIAGQHDVLLDYYVEAVDLRGNTRRSDIQHVYVGPGGGGGSDVASIAPNPVVAGQSATIEYDPAGRSLSGAASVYLHYGFNGWSPVVSPDPLMTWNAAESVWQITVPVPLSAMMLDMVFNNGAGTWDNNGGADWHFPVTGGGAGGTWTMDGQLDADAALIAQNSGIHLYAGMKGNTLYVACEDAGEGNDHFIYVARIPGALRSANWAKSGMIAAWDAFLADENDNDYEGWFDAGGANQAATGPNGGVLEGTLDLAGEFGSLPQVIYLAVGLYATPDGGALLATHQVPPSINGDGNIDAGEYLLYRLPGFGDWDGDGNIDLTDFARLFACFSGPGAAHGSNCDRLDYEPDGDIDLLDVHRFQNVVGD